MNYFAAVLFGESSGHQYLQTMSFSASMNSRLSLYRVMMVLIANMKKLFEASLTSVFQANKISTLSYERKLGRHLVSRVIIQEVTFVLEAFFLSSHSLTSQRSNTKNGINLSMSVLISKISSWQSLQLDSLLISCPTYI